jgi:predicted MPP superfamily phosphohydrolase
MAKKSLQFRTDGTFKIVQFTDLHWKNGEPDDQQTYELMKRILEQETPDLIVFTGDMIHSEMTLNPKESFLESVKIADQLGIPWAAVFGNHDAEVGVTREELMELQQQSEFCVAESGPSDVKGVGNFVIEVQGVISQQVAAALYCFDSGSYSLEQVEGYEWIDMTQIAWYLEQSTAFAKSNNGSPLPALAFFHIPLPEYQELWNLYTCYGHNYEGVGCSLVTLDFSLLLSK